MAASYNFACSRHHVHQQVASFKSSTCRLQTTAIKNHLQKEDAVYVMGVLPLPLSLTFPLGMVLFPVLSAFACLLDFLVYFI